MLLAVDVGLWKLGVAYWDKGRLVHATTVRRPTTGATQGASAWIDMVKELTLPARGGEVVIESMQIDGRPSGSILELQAIVGAIAALAYDKQLKVTTYTPRVWKKSMSKEVSKARAKELLSIEELETVDYKATHDTWDAIALGQYYIKQKREM